MTLEPGRALVEFFCPETPLEVAAFNVEMSIKHRGSAFTEHLDYKHGAVINVTRGKAIQGVFHTPHTWRLKTAGEIRPAGMDDEAVENLA